VIRRSQWAKYRRWAGNFNPQNIEHIPPVEIAIPPWSLTHCERLITASPLGGSTNSISLANSILKILPIFLRLNVSLRLGL